MKKILVAFLMTIVLVGCQEETPSTNNELSENVQQFSPHQASYEYFVDFYNAVQDALNEELELADVYTAFDELEEEKRDIQSELVDVTSEALSEAADELLTIADARTETLQDEAAIFDEIESQFNDAEEILDTVMARGYSTQGEELMEVVTERLETQRAILSGKHEIISRETELYQLFQNDESTQEEINEQTEAVSAAYVDVADESDVLGERTDALNEVLESLYEFMN